MKNVTMLRNHRFSPDGVSVAHFDMGSTYELADEVADKLISDGLAELAAKPKKNTKESSVDASN